MNTHLRDNLLASEPVGSLHYYIRAATTTETTVNAFALECNATQVSRTTYSALNTLVSALSYPFGTGNGSTTFHLPDVQGRSLVAMASGGHTSVNAVGDADGLAKASRTPNPSGSTSVDGNHSHTVTWGTKAVQSGGGVTVVDSPFDTLSAGDHLHTFSGTGAFVVAGVYAVKY